MGVVPGRSEMKLSITKQSTQKVSLGSGVQLFHWVYSVLLQLSLHCRTGYTLLQDCSYTLCAEKGERKLSEHLTGRKTHTPQTFTVCHQQKDRQRLGRDPLTQNIGPQMNGTAFLANIFGLFEHHA